MVKVALRLCELCGDEITGSGRKYCCPEHAYKARKAKTLKRKEQGGGEEEYDPGDSNTAPIRWLDKKESEFDGREWIKHLISQQELDDKASDSQDVATVEIALDHPIGIVHSADWHLASLATDHKSWAEAFEYLLKEDSLFVVCLGDEIDVMQGFRVVSARSTQMVGVRRQEDLLKWVFDELVTHNKILCAGFGNHETEFAEKCWGTSYSARVKAERVPYFDGMGQLIVRIGGVEYRGALVHRTRFQSFLNPLHGNIRLQQLHFPHSHWIATAHTHEPAFGCMDVFPEARAAGLDFGGPQMLIKTGTFKTKDLYSKRYFGRGVIGEPTLVIHPGEREMCIFSSPQQAVTYIKGWKATHGRKKSPG